MAFLMGQQLGRQAAAAGSSSGQHTGGTVHGT